MAVITRLINAMAPCPCCVRQLGEQLWALMRSSVMLVLSASRSWG